MSCYGQARCGSARLGRAGVVSSGLLWRVRVRQGALWRGRRGGAVLGVVSLGKVWQARQEWQVRARRGMVRIGLALFGRLGKSGRGTARKV